MEPDRPRPYTPGRDMASGEADSAERFRSEEAEDFDRLLEGVLASLSVHMLFDWSGLVVREEFPGALVVENVGASEPRRGALRAPAGSGRPEDPEASRSAGPGPRDGAGRWQLTTSWLREESGALRASATAFSDRESAHDLPDIVKEEALPAAWGTPLLRTLHERGFRRALSMPIGRSTSALLFASRGITPFNGRGRDLLESLAPVLGRAFESSGRERELERRIDERTRELAVLYEVSRAAGTTLGDGDLVRLVMESLHSLLDYDAGAVLLDLPGSREISIHVARPVAPEARDEAARAAREAYRRYSGAGATDLPAVVRTLGVFEPEAAVLQGRFVVHEAAPLLRQGRVVGVVVVSSRRRGALPESRVRLLHTIANQASLTLDRMRTLQEAEAVRVQSIIDSMPSGVLMTDRDSRIAFTNPAARRALEILSPGPGVEVLTDLGGTPMDDVVGPIFREGRAGASIEVRSTDPRRIFEVAVSPLLGSSGGSGSPAGIVMVLSDVTEARLLQEQLLQSEKLSALGEMISGVAHELNNPLTSVMGFSQLLQAARVRKDVRLKLQIIESESQRCQRIVQNLLSFARKHAPERRLVDVNVALGSVLGLLSYQLRTEGIQTRTALSPALPGMLGDFHRLQQVFLNLMNNAYQAMRGMGGGGTLEVSSRYVEDEGGGRLRVEIRDTGPGIAPEHLERVFDPFFTTKPAGEGTGLGLSIARGIVAEHQGRILAKSDPGQGTLFVVELPSSGGAAETDESGPAPATAEGATADGATPSWILVVEDEAPLARLLVQAFEARGYRVDLAADGREAMRRIGRRDYDAIVSDLKMPVMDGRELFEEVRRRNPDLARRIVFATGDVASPASRRFLEEAGAEVILKPFRIEDVLRTVVALLERRRGPE